MTIDAGTYKVDVGCGLIDGTGETSARIRGNNSSRRCCIVSDDNVFPLYGERVAASLADAGFSPAVFTVPAGEKSKDMATLGEAVSFFARSGLERDGLVFALGGGVVGDLAGFASAVYMRGADFVAIPTTLLAMVDSSIGGKTGVNISQGKNLVGAFHRPAAVIADLDTLTTLPREEYSHGLSEAVKTAASLDSALFARMEAGNPIHDTVETCIKRKSEVVLRDEFDFGERMKLNFGHTVAHAIEKLSSYTVAHGDAVAAGMAVVTRASVRAGICGADVDERLRSLLNKLGIPFSCGYNAAEITDACACDKKRTGGGYNVVVPVDIGNVKIERMSRDGLLEFVSMGLE